MEPTSERASRALEDYRATTGFGPGRKEAVRERLEASIDAGQAEAFLAELDQAPALEGSEGPAAGHTSGSRRVWGVAALALAAGLAGLWFVQVRLGDQVARDEAEQAVYAEEQPKPEVHEPMPHEASRVPAPRDAPSQPEPQVEPEPEPEAKPDPEPSRVRSPKRSTPAPAPQAGDLAVELGLLREARAEMAAGKPKKALAVLDDHAKRFARGQLVQERGALRVEALCEVDPLRGRKARDRFVKRHPGSSHAKRVRSLTCGAAGPEKSTGE